MFPSTPAAKCTLPLAAPKNIDFRKLPPDSQRFNRLGVECVTQLTVGDVDGNLPYVLQVDYMVGIFNIEQTDYMNFYTTLKSFRAELQKLTLYKKPYSTELNDKKDYLIEVIKKLEFKENDVFIRYLGDQLAERSEHDELMLRLIQIKKEQKCRFEIMLSNHDLFLLYAYFNDFNIDHPQLEAYQSLANLLKNIQYVGEKYKTEIKTLIREYYLPNLKLLNYQYLMNNNEIKGINIFTHAPVPLYIVAKLAEELEVEYNDKTPQDLAKTIDLLNEKFLPYLEKYFAKLKLERKDLYVIIKDLPKGGGSFNAVTAILQICWQRYESFYTEIVATGILLRPIIHNNYLVMFTHGHDRRLTDEKFKELFISIVKTEMKFLNFEKDAATAVAYEILSSRDTWIATLKQLDLTKLNFENFIKEKALVLLNLLTEGSDSDSSEEESNNCELNSEVKEKLESLLPKLILLAILPIIEQQNVFCLNNSFKYHRFELEETSQIPLLITQYSPILFLNYLVDAYLNIMMPYEVSPTAALFKTYYINSNPDKEQISQLQQQFVAVVERLSLQEITDESFKNLLCNSNPKYKFPHLLDFQAAEFSAREQVTALIPTVNASVEKSFVLSKH